MSDIEIKEEGTTGTIILYALLLPPMLLFTFLAYASGNTAALLATTLLTAAIPFEINRHAKLRKLAKAPLIRFTDKEIYIRKKRNSEARNIEYSAISAFTRTRNRHTTKTSFTLKLNSGELFELSDSYRDHEAKVIAENLLKKLPHLSPKHGWESKEYSEYA
ncbi:hypothetical protein OU997_16530 [Pseudomonas sp. SL4(2022)]|uniref:hypothetical protein n=1 Tax=Pseudomonas sp. SL4(2022) TaxID=2994661 RepID=UPI002271E2C6|nr:hypothetical protein [Pseudomonas sp. SL4(2022)]WAC43841.1 hypothetical protein OU997_16530 [Pseudomonas sp. SL4(2022)]